MPRRISNSLSDDDIERIWNETDPISTVSNLFAHEVSKILEREEREATRSTEDNDIQCDQQQ